MTKNRGKIEYVKKSEITLVEMRSTMSIMRNTLNVVNKIPDIA